MDGLEKRPAAHSSVLQTIRRRKKSAKAEGNFALCFDYEEGKTNVKKNADYLAMYIFWPDCRLYMLVGLAKELPLEAPGIKRGNRL